MVESVLFLACAPVYSVRLIRENLRASWEIPVNLKFPGDFLKWVRGERERYSFTRNIKLTIDGCRC